jgi:endonuclease YncB( thermonuclease family)
MGTFTHSARLIAAVGFVAFVVPAAPAAATTVVRVVDGDTVKVRDGKRLRTVDLAGVEAPERGVCGSSLARRGLARLLPVGARVRLQRDSAAPASARYVIRAGRLINARVLRRGLARTASNVAGLNRRVALEAAAKHAQRTRRGIWKACDFPPSRSTPPARQPSAGQDAAARAQADLADRVFIRITSTSILNSSETRLHLCRDGYAVMDTSWSNDAIDASGVSRVEGAWEVVSAEYTATTATARVRLFNADGETFRTFRAEGQRVLIDGIEMTHVAASDLCAVRPGGEPPK